MSQYSDRRVVCLSSSWMALSTDIITEYAFAKSYGHLDSTDFKGTMHDALVAAYITGHFALRFPIVFPILDSSPDWLVLKLHPALLPAVGIRKALYLIVLLRWL